MNVLNMPSEETLIRIAEALENGSATTVSRAGDTMNGILNVAHGLILEVRTTDPINPKDGQIWLRSDI